MITIGVDAHKRMHVALALDDVGQELGHWRGLNSAAGWQSLARWTGELGCPRQWAIEGAWNYGRGLAQQLVVVGETVYEVNARWTALGRRSARRPGKTDRLDAHAVALLARREASTLPRVSPEDDTAILALLTTEREAALGEATRLGNQIHALLMQLNPEYHDRLPSLRSRAGLDTIGRFSTDAELAAYAGAAPLEASSAGSTRHRLNRGGNRRLNAILYRIALTQAHYLPEARAYLDRRVSEGKSRREAIRALKRFIVRAIWRLWQECEGKPVSSPVENVA